MREIKAHYSSLRRVLGAPGIRHAIAVASMLLALTYAGTTRAQEPMLQNTRDVLAGIGVQESASSRLIARVQFSCAAVSYANVDYWLHSQRPSGTTTDTFIDATQYLGRDYATPGILAIEFWLQREYHDIFCKSLDGTNHRAVAIGWVLKRRFVNASTGQAEPFHSSYTLTNDKLHPDFDQPFVRRICSVPSTNWRYPLSLGISVKEYATGSLNQCCQQRGSPFTESLRLTAPVADHSFVAHDATVVQVAGRFNSQAIIDAVWIERTTDTKTKVKTSLGMSKSSGAAGAQGDVINFQGDVQIQGGQNYMQIYARDSCNRVYLLKWFYVSTLAANVAANKNPKPG